MIVIADSSPLIILAKLDCFDLLNRLYLRLHISAEVYGEVVVAGAGLPGAQQVASSAWIEVTSIQNRTALIAAQSKSGLGLGELSTIVLGTVIFRRDFYWKFEECAGFCLTPQHPFPERRMLVSHYRRGPCALGRLEGV